MKLLLKLVLSESESMMGGGIKIRYKLLRTFVPLRGQDPFF